MTIQRALTDAELSQVSKSDQLSNDLFHFSLQQRVLVNTGESVQHDPTTIVKADGRQPARGQFRAPGKRSTPEEHRRGISQDTENMPPAMRGVMGGPSDRRQQGFDKPPSAKVDNHKDSQGSTAHHGPGRDLDNPESMREQTERQHRELFGRPSTGEASRDRGPEVDTSEWDAGNTPEPEEDMDDEDAKVDEGTSKPSGARPGQPAGHLHVQRPHPVFNRALVVKAIRQVLAES